MLGDFGTKKRLRPSQDGVDRDTCGALAHLVATGSTQESSLPLLNLAWRDIRELDCVNLFYPALPSSLPGIKSLVPATDSESVSQNPSKRYCIAGECFRTEIRFSLKFVEKIADRRMSLENDLRLPFELGECDIPAVRAEINIDLSRLARCRCLVWGTKIKGVTRTLVLNPYGVLI